MFTRSRVAGSDVSLGFLRSRLLRGAPAGLAVSTLLLRTNTRGRTRGKREEPNRLKMMFYVPGHGGAMMIMVRVKDHALHVTPNSKEGLCDL